MKHVFVVLAGGFLVLGIGGFLLLHGNSYSKAELKLEIFAPENAVMGEEISYTVQWKNNGDTVLEQAFLVFEYPDNAVPSGGSLERTTQNIEDIYPGQQNFHVLKARLFGAQGHIQTARAFLSFKPRNLNARYESETSATTIISMVPLNFDLDAPSRIEPNQDFDFALNYFSHSEYPLSHLKIAIEYPEGFVLSEATPASLGGNEWRVALLNKAQGGRIALRGTLQGELQEVKLFRATIGIWEEGSFILLKEAVKGVEITRPAIRISQTINGDDPMSLAVGQPLHYEIFFRNVSEKDLENLFLIVTLEGKPFDFSTLRAQDGSFKQGDNSIVWDARTVPKLRLLKQGEEGKAEFWITLQETAGKNLAVKNRVLLSEARAEFEKKVATTLRIDQAGYFQDEVFGNTGPLPPAAGQKTTYTVIWKIHNSSNDVKNAKVRATLPPEIALTGKVFPEGALVTFDSASREVVWSAGDIVGGAGFADPAVSVAFQVAFLPQGVQKGTMPHIVGQAFLTGDDVWTGHVLSNVDAPLDTALADDLSSQGKGVVQ